MPDLAQQNGCSSEWTKYGSCCDTTDLTPLTTYERKTIERNIKHVTKVVKKMARSIRELPDHLKNADSKHFKDQAKKFANHNAQC